MAIENSPDSNPSSDEGLEIVSAHKHEAVFGDQEAKDIIKWAETLVKQWHDDIKPDYIFLTETKGVPAGYVIKETWKQAYPTEDVPQFFKINPGAPIVYGRKMVWNSPITRFGNGKWEEKEIVPDKQSDRKISKYITDRVKKDNSRIIVFDEGNTYPNGFEAITKFSENGKIVTYSLLDSLKLDEISPDVVTESLAAKYGVSFDKLSAVCTADTSHTSGRTAKFISDALNREKLNTTIWTSRQARQGTGENNDDPATNGVYYLQKKKITNKYFSHGTKNPKMSGQEYHEGLLDEDLIGFVSKSPEKNMSVKAYIEELKELGIKAGDELRTNIEKTKKVSS